METKTVIRFPNLRDPKYPVHKIADQLEPYLTVIVEKFHPEKIILFGSQAYGDPTEHSDVDLLIVRENPGSMLASNLEIRRALRDVDAPSISFTFISTTHDLLQEELGRHSTFFEEIVDRGLELYAA